MDNINDRGDKLWYIHTGEYYKAMEMNKLLVCTGSWLNNNNAE